MATGIKLFAMFFCIAMATGDHHIMTSLDELADIQRGLFVQTLSFFNATVNNEVGKLYEQLKSLEARLDDVEGRLQDYAFKIPPAELASSCDAERALVRLNSSLVMWYERLVHRLVAVEELVQFIAESETNAARTGNDNQVPVNAEPEPEPMFTTTTTRKTTTMTTMETKPKMTTAAILTRMATAEITDEPENDTTPTPSEIETTEPRRPKTTTTTRAPTTRRTTTLPPTTTTLPPTTTTIPTTTTPPTTTPVPTTPMPTPATCAELAQRGETQSGLYHIDPTRSGDEFLAFCELPKGVTSIGHSVDSEEVHNNNFESPGSFSLDPEYAATIGQMRALTAASQNCSQFIKYRCKGAVLLATDKKSGLQYGHWTSVDGEQIVSWGGAPINSGKCACALTREGCMSSKNCNCDSNPKSWAMDEGLITDKPYLPVTNVHLGDTGSKKEEGYLTLGPLRCQ